MFSPWVVFKNSSSVLKWLWVSSEMKTMTPFQILAGLLMGKQRDEMGLIIFSVISLGIDYFLSDFFFSLKGKTEGRDGADYFFSDFFFSLDGKIRGTRWG
jgi:hypothetical protein